MLVFFPSFLPPTVCWDAAMNHVTVSYCSIVMGDTIAKSVFPQTSGSMIYNLTMLVVVCVVYFVADCGLKLGMRKVGCWECASMSTHCRIWRYLANSSLMSSVSFGTIEGEKCANINMPLKERWLGVQKRRSSPDPRLQLFLSAGKQSSLFIYHMARPPLLLTQHREMLRKPCDHEQGTNMGKIILENLPLVVGGIFLDL